jgi:cell division septum initiation protein DivIVA
MSEYNDVVADGREDPFDSERRGYARRQVDEYIAWRNGQIRELESKLTQGLSEIERLRRELTEARDAGGRPAHEAVSERVGQILKLAADEAKSERENVAAEITQMRDIAKADTDKLRADVKDETDRLRAEAQDRAERMLTAAQEQSERAVSSARAEADSLVSAAQQSAEQTVNDATKHADSTVAAAIAQAKQQLDDATARATAIHDGAERRLNLLISRHTETVRRLTEIRDVVTSLVAGEAARGSLEDEVTRALAGQPAPADRQSSGPHDAPHGGGAHRARQAAQPTESRRSGASPLDGPAEPHAARQSRPSPLDRDQSDPLGTDRAASARHQVQAGDTAQLPADTGDLDDDDSRQDTSDTLIH